MNDLLIQIRIQAAILSAYESEPTTALDTQLGVIEALVYTARQSISDEWRALRDSRPKRTASTPRTIDSLL